uniref:lysozyme n=1 Tax=Laticauda laticaudata TaxID=8630 RepID=A0A8C5SL68_LATLA
MKSLPLTLLFLFIAANEAKVFTNRELASTLTGKDMDGYRLQLGFSFIIQAFYTPFLACFLPGICMDYHENGSHDYGIFQINSHYWCNNKQSPTANDCNKPCSAFINDDITDDIVCAKRIVRDPQKMGAWVAWRNHCKGRDLSQWTRGCRL